MLPDIRPFVISSRNLTIVSLSMSVVLAVLSLLGGDWMWFVVNLLSATLLVLPQYKDLGYYYSRQVIRLTMMAPALMICLYLFDNLVFSIRDFYFLDVSYYTYATAAIQSLQCCVTGLMFALILTRSGVIKMTLVWTAVFSLVFAMSVSALDLLFTFCDLYSKGYPVFNVDFTDGDVGYTNRMIMSSPLTATVVTAVFAVALIVAERGKDLTRLIVDGEHAKPSAELDEVDEPEPCHSRNCNIRRFGIDELVCTGSALALLIGTAASGNGEHGPTAVMCAVICLLPLAIRLSGLFRLPTPLTMLVCTASILHGFGLILGLYDTVSHYDTVTHTLSSMTIAICVFYTLMCFQVYSKTNIGFSGNGIALFTGLITLTFSTYWEVIELAKDVLTGSHAQYSPFDTLTDMVCDTTGMLIASFLIGVYMRNHTTEHIVGSFQLSDRLKSVLFRDEE